MAVVWRLPRWMLYWTTIRVYSNAMEQNPTKTPDDLTYNDVANAAKVRR